ncbi:MAG TPA: hypothetical protein VGN23_05750 [Verrucomicrobiae bacterium]|jgi:hypothetical protein
MKIAPAWFASVIKRFRQMPRGWFRLLIIIYGVSLAAIFMAIANCGPTNKTVFESIAGAIIWLYWPAIWLWLWICDGFQKDKKLDAIKLETDGNNRNN